MVENIAVKNKNEYDVSETTLIYVLAAMKISIF